MPLEKDKVKETLFACKLAFEGCHMLFTEIRNDWTDPRSDCRAGWALIDTIQKKIDEALTALEEEK